jgi:hypothetical protein
MNRKQARNKAFILVVQNLLDMCNSNLAKGLIVAAISVSFGQVNRALVFRFGAAVTTARYYPG